MSKVHQTSSSKQLEQLREEFNEFVYIVSHDLKAPVRAINNLSVWLEEDLEENTSEEIVKNLNLLRNRANRLDLMIEALLKFSRVNSSNINLEEVNLHELVCTVTKQFSSNDNIQLVIDNQLPLIISDKEKLNFIWEQLLHNAVRFNNTLDLKIYINYNLLGNFHQLEVADNGCGVPDTALDKIFKLFYTIAPKDSVNSTGAGLTIARKKIQVLGGEMWAANNSYGGLSIYFTLPIN
jgi:signal transduction histidine kinase